MEVFLVIRRKKTSIYLEAKDEATVYHLKKMIQAITKVIPENQELYKNNQVMENDKILKDYGLESSTASICDPGELGLAYKDDETLEFECLEITPYSNPPELPDVLKNSMEPPPNPEVKMTS